MRIYLIKLIAVCSPSKIQSLKGCLQSVKDTKFESNSQLCRNTSTFLVGCLQSVKDTKFESNSQRRPRLMLSLRCCLQSVKDTKFESNSQLIFHISSYTDSCLQSVKDTKFESNSQLGDQSIYSAEAVCSPSKIQSLKAIHNLFSSICTTEKLFAVRQRYKV